MDNKMMSLIHDAASRQALRDSAEAGQMTLGEIVAMLRSFDPAMPIQLEGGGSPGSLDSYRGYYEMLSIERGKEGKTVGDFLDMADAAIGATFQGYKGGDFTMTRQTPVWISEYGEASGIGVVDVTESDGAVVIKGKRID